MTTKGQAFRPRMKVSVKCILGAPVASEESVVLRGSVWHQGKQQLCRKEQQVAQEAFGPPAEPSCLLMPANSRGHGLKNGFLD